MSNDEDLTAFTTAHHDCISGSHILHNHQVLDAFGHLSFRHPLRKDVFVMPRKIPPATICSPNDLVEYLVENAEPVHARSPAGYLERFIHSECYKRFPGINSIVHSHSEAVVPYSINSVPLRAVYHMGSFLGDGVPVWDIQDTLQDGDDEVMLVRNMRLGESLAAAFGNVIPKPSGDLPEYPAVLMRGHGFTLLAKDVRECVMRAIYMQKNATVQTTALLVRYASSFGGIETAGIKYLSKVEATATATVIGRDSQRPWELWLWEVEASGLYVNLVKSPEGS